VRRFLIAVALVAGALASAANAAAASAPASRRCWTRKTGERADFVFALRACHVGKTYINATIIPSLCQRAGVPTADVRGNITSHRARSTIASQLYNAGRARTQGRSPVH
jgi:hypothetical protein